jgi:hypothetical protein
LRGWRQCSASSLVLTSPLPASPTSLRVKMPPSSSIPRVETNGSTALRLSPSWLTCSGARLAGISSLRWGRGHHGSLRSLARFALGWGWGFAERRVQNPAGRLFCCRVVDDFCGYQKSRPAGFWPPQVAYLPALFPHRKTPTSQSKRPSPSSTLPIQTSQSKRPSSFFFSAKHQPYSRSAQVPPA